RRGCAAARRPVHAGPRARGAGGYLEPLPLVTIGTLDYREACDQALNAESTARGDASAISSTRASPPNAVTRGARSIGGVDDAGDSSASTGTVMARRRASVNARSQIDGKPWRRRGS